MSNPAIKIVEIGDNPYVLIQCPPKIGGGFDIKVKANGIGSQDEIAIILLSVVETITGVSTDLYIQEVDITRRAAKQDGGGLSWVAR